MMSLDSAVDLVLFAIQHGQPGDTFVQKAPAAKIGQLARVLQRLFKRENELKVIGTRHGEKKHEALLTREEMLRAKDLGGYYRIPSDTRDLNYALYFEQGERKVTELEDYTSANTRQLTDEELAELLRSEDYIQEELRH